MSPNYSEADVAPVFDAIAAADTIRVRIWKKMKDGKGGKGTGIDTWTDALSLDVGVADASSMPSEEVQKDEREKVETRNLEKSSYSPISVFDSIESLINASTEARKKAHFVAEEANRRARVRDEAITRILPKWKKKKKEVVMGEKKENGRGRGKKVASRMEEKTREEVDDSEGREATAAKPKPLPLGERLEYVRSNVLLLASNLTRSKFVTEMPLSDREEVSSSSSSSSSSNEDAIDGNGHLSSIGSASSSRERPETDEISLEDDRGANTKGERRQTVEDVRMESSAEEDEAIISNVPLIRSHKESATNGLPLPPPLDIIFASDSDNGNDVTEECQTEENNPPLASSTTVASSSRDPIIVAIVAAGVVPPPEHTHRIGAEGAAADDKGDENGTHVPIAAEDDAKANPETDREVRNHRDPDARGAAIERTAAEEETGGLTGHDSDGYRPPREESNIFQETSHATSASAAAAATGGERGSGRYHDHDQYNSHDDVKSVGGASVAKWGDTTSPNDEGGKDGGGRDDSNYPKDEAPGDTDNKSGGGEIRREDEDMDKIVGRDDTLVLTVDDDEGLEEADEEEQQVEVDTAIYTDEEDAPMEEPCENPKENEGENEYEEGMTTVQINHDALLSTPVVVVDGTDEDVYAGDAASVATLDEVTPSDGGQPPVDMLEQGNDGHDEVFCGCGLQKDKADDSDKWYPAAVPACEASSTAECRRVENHCDGAILLNNGGKDDLQEEGDDFLTVVQGERATGRIIEQSIPYGNVSGEEDEMMRTTMSRTTSLEEEAFVPSPLPSGEKEKRGEEAEEQWAGSRISGIKGEQREGCVETLVCCWSQKGKEKWRAVPAKGPPLIRAFEKNSLRKRVRRAVAGITSATRRGYFDGDNTIGSVADEYNADDAGDSGQGEHSRAIEDSLDTYSDEPIGDIRSCLVRKARKEMRDPNGDSRSLADEGQRCGGGVVLTKEFRELNEESMDAHRCGLILSTGTLTTDEPLEDGVNSSFIGEIERTETFVSTLLLEAILRDPNGEGAQRDEEEACPFPNEAQKVEEELPLAGKVWEAIKSEQRKSPAKTVRDKERENHAQDKVNDTSRWSGKVGALHLNEAQETCEKGQHKINTPTIEILQTVRNAAEAPKANQNADSILAGESRRAGHMEDQGAVEQIILVEEKQKADKESSSYILKENTKEEGNKVDLVDTHVQGASTRCGHSDAESQKAIHNDSDDESVLTEESRESSIKKAKETVEETPLGEEKQEFGKECSPVIYQTQSQDAWGAIFEEDQDITEDAYSQLGSYSQTMLEERRGGFNVLDTRKNSAWDDTAEGYVELDLSANRHGTNEMGVEVALLEYFDNLNGCTSLQKDTNSNGSEVHGYTNGIYAKNKWPGKGKHSKFKNEKRVTFSEWDQEIIIPLESQLKTQKHLKEQQKPIQKDFEEDSLWEERILYACGINNFVSEDDNYDYTSLLMSYSDDSENSLTNDSNGTLSYDHLDSYAFEYIDYLHDTLGDTRSLSVTC